MKSIFITIITFCFFLMPSVVNACSCATGDPPSEFNRAKAVFTGRMLGGTEKLTVKDEKGKQSQLEAGQIRFAVEELFKGDIPKEITITIESMKGTSCGDYGLKRGEVYVVWAYGTEKDENLLYSGVCTRTSQINSKYVEEDLKFLRSLPPSGTGGNLQGRIWIDVKKVSGGSAEPFPKIKIKITGEDDKTVIVTTNDKGEFEVNKIKAGKYRLEPQLPQNYHLKDDFEEVEVADRGTAGVGFEAYFTGEVAGRVVDKNGIGFNSIFLQLLSTDEDENQRNVYGHSDRENGEFTAQGVPPGEYVLFLELQHNDYNQERKYYYPGTFKREDAAVIKVELGGKVEGLNFILPDEFLVRTVEGQVFWKDGKPASDVEVVLLCPQSERPDGFAVEFSPTQTTTDKDGKFKLEGFTGEVYSLGVRGENGDSTFHSPPKKIVLPENLKNIKLILSENGFSGGCGK